MVAALSERQLKCSNFPGRKRGKGEKGKRGKGEKEGKEETEKEGKERKKRNEKEKEKNGRNSICLSQIICHLQMPANNTNKSVLQRNFALSKISSDNLI